MRTNSRDDSWALATGAPSQNKSAKLAHSQCLPEEGHENSPGQVRRNGRRPGNARQPGCPAPEGRNETRSHAHPTIYGVYRFSPASSATGSRLRSGGSGHVA